MLAKFATPGVYINEVDAFPNAVVAVATAVPVFVGYTPKAEYAGKSLLNTPQKISSMQEFAAYFLLDDPLPPADPARQYSPGYFLVTQTETAASGPSLEIGDQPYTLLPDPATIYYLYNSVRMFYQNGGGDAYIVSVGAYGPPSRKPMADPARHIVNPNVLLDDLQAGLSALAAEQGPTMLVMPEATLLSVEDNASLMQTALEQAGRMQTMVCLFDVIGGASPDPLLYPKDIETFRQAIGSTGLDYGVAYYPFIGTTVMQQADVDFRNLFGGDVSQLLPLLSPPSAPDRAAGDIIAAILKPPATPIGDRQLQAALIDASAPYSHIMAAVLGSANLMPPSGAIAGVYATNDARNGVWSAPANTAIAGAVSLPLHLTDSAQMALNVDAVSGKSVNAIRAVNGRGIVVWGARTLDGNSQDWRYVPVRRTMIFLEQSVKLAARAFVFEPNDQNTWTSVNSMIASFLTGVWQQGGLQGASPADAFQVTVGLGTTMTADDVLNGVMRVSVQVAVLRPAEFLVFTFEQQQARS